jgi:hypothetical protein
MEDLSFLSEPVDTTVVLDSFNPDVLEFLKPKSCDCSSVDIAIDDNFPEYEPQAHALSSDDAKCELVNRIAELEYRLLWASVAASGGDEMRSELGLLEVQVRKLNGQVRRDFVARERDYRQLLLANLENLPDLELARDALEMELAEATAKFIRSTEAKAAQCADLLEAKARAARYAAEFGHIDPEG